LTFVLLPARLRRDVDASRAKALTPIAENTGFSARPLRLCDSASKH
jgi:hypothetical protein